MTDIMKRNIRSLELDKILALLAEETACEDAASLALALEPAVTLKEVNRRLADKQLGVKLTPEAKTFIVDSGYDPVYGARPLKRFLQSKVETLIAKKIIQGNIKPRETLLVDYDGKQLVVKDEG